MPDRQKKKKTPPKSNKTSNETAETHDENETTQVTVDQPTNNETAETRDHQDENKTTSTTTGQSTIHPTTSVSPSVPPINDSTNEELLRKINEQQQIITNLTNRIVALEGNVLQLEGHLAVVQNTNILLQKKSDDLEAYSRRPCIILSGIKKEKNEAILDLKQTVIEHLENTGLPKQEIEKNIDKLHRTGQFNKEKKTQPVIVRFTNHSFKEKIYYRRKAAKTKNAKVNISPSLTQLRKEVLDYTTDYLKKNYGNENHIDENEIMPKFTFADVHGNLKMVLNNPFKNRFVFSFSTILEFHQLLDHVTTTAENPYSESEEEEL